MNISLPGQMRDWMLERTEYGEYANNSDYVRDLIRKDKQRANTLEVLQDANLRSSIKRLLRDVCKVNHNVATFKLYPEAELDLDDIWQYTVKTWSDDLAVKYIDDIEAVFLLLAENHFLGRVSEQSFNHLSE